ncbi:MAG: MBL fold metallo-hydrolase, partial [bacterium]|nr:MBL fold metallo-hydrolase [bacterium]
NYHRKFLPIPSVEAEFFDAGHILGSAMVCLNIKSGNRDMRFGFSGDIGRKNLPILKDPENMPALDYLVLESTYGNRLHDDYGLAEQELADIVNDAYRNKGKIIIPAFAVERTQELIYLLHVLVKDKKIPNIPIFVDSPMAVNATSIFKVHPECFDEETYKEFLEGHIDPFGFDNIKYVSSVRDSRGSNKVDGPAVIISASGMAENGRILHHLKNHIEKPTTVIAAVGYMAAHTLGRKLVEKARKVKLFGKEYRVNAQVKTLNAFSGHADYSEIIPWVQKLDLKRLKRVFLVHGENRALSSMKQRLLDS